MRRNIDVWPHPKFRNLGPVSDAHCDILDLIAQGIDYLVDAAVFGLLYEPMAQQKIFTDPSALL